MVAVAVLLAAAVYAWVSVYAWQSEHPTKLIAMNGEGRLQDHGAYDTKTYGVATATHGLRWSDLVFMIDGVVLSYADDAAFSTRDFAAAGPAYCVATDGAGCGATLPEGIIGAGHQVVIAAPSLPGATLHVVDVQANALILTVTVG